MRGSCVAAAATAVLGTVVEPLKCTTTTGAATDTETLRLLQIVARFMGVEPIASP